MTSKSLSIRLMKEDGKRRLWVLALTFLTAFFCITVSLAMYISGYDAYRYRDIDKGEVVLALFLQRGDAFKVLYTLAAAVLCGLSSFSYLHNKKKVDFFHSLPVKREKIFLANYANGIVIYAISLLANWFLSLILAVANGAPLGEALVGSPAMLGFHIAWFILIYSVMVLSAVLTGNLVVNLLGSAVLLFYGSIVCMLIKSYYSTMFVTYVSGHSSFLDRLAVYSSPVIAYISGSSGWGALLAAAVVLAVTLWLFRIRRSEAAGKAMAFSHSKAPIKVAVVLASSMGAGLIFYGIMDTAVWMLFGIICGCLLSYSVIEIIYHFDFKKALAHKIHLAGCAVTVVLIFSIFQFDPFGYDSYLPDPAKVESISISYSNNAPWVNYDMTVYDSERDYFYNYTRQDYRLDNMRVTEYDVIYPILNRAVELSGLFRKNRRAPVLETLKANYKIQGRYQYLNSVAVCYRLNNGRKVYRKYEVWLGDMQEEAYRLFNSEQYKQGVYPVLSMEADNLNQIIYQEYDDIFDLKLTKADSEEILKAYQQDLLESQVQQITDEVPIGTLSFISNDLDTYYKKSVELGHVTDNRLKWMSNQNQYPLFKSYHRTAQLLSSHGVALGQSLSAGDIGEIRISDYAYGRLSTRGQAAITEDMAVNENGYISSGYQDKEQIEALLSSLVYAPYRDFNEYLSVDSDLDVRADIKKGNGSIKTYDFLMIKSRVPDFVMEDLKFDQTRTELQE